MATNSAEASGVKGIDELTIIPSDFLNNFLAGFGASSATSSAALSSRDWGVHNNTLDMGGGSSLSIKQVLLWGGVALLGYWLVKKIRGK